MGKKAPSFPLNFNNIPKDPRWYVITCLSNCELTVKQSILKLKEQDRYSGLIESAAVPVQETETVSSTGKVTKKNIPIAYGYVYIKCKMCPTVYYAVKGISNVKMFLLVGGTPAYLSMVDVDNLHLENDYVEETSFNMHVGDKFRVISGQFKKMLPDVYIVEKISEKNIITHAVYNGITIPIAVDKNNIEIIK